MRNKHVRFKQGDKVKTCSSDTVYEIVSYLPNYDGYAVKKDNLQMFFIKEEDAIDAVQLELNL